MDSIQLTPIGHVVSGREKPQDDQWDSVPCSIQLDPAQFSEEALAGLGDFSHIVVVFYFHKVDPKKIVLSARHPRNNPDWPRVGIFSQRGKNRPNQIGVTVCSLERVDGLVIQVKGLDAIMNTPVLDIKPWFAEYGPRGEVMQPSWVSEVMKRYW